MSNFFDEILETFALSYKRIGVLTAYYYTAPTDKHTLVEIEFLLQSKLIAIQYEQNEKSFTVLPGEKFPYKKLGLTRLDDKHKLPVFKKPKVKEQKKPKTIKTVYTIQLLDKSNKLVKTSYIGHNKVEVEKRVNTDYPGCYIFRESFKRLKQSKHEKCKNNRG